MHDTAKATTKDEKGELLVDVDEDKSEETKETERVAIKKIGNGRS
jgi:hypothetical protein